MAAELLPMLARAGDTNNNPMSGAKWYFYATGTSTPLSVYTTAALATAHTNPVVADGAGKFAPIYFDASLVYRGVLKSSDGATTIFDIDPINSGPVAAASLGISAKQFGAVGDGIADDTAAIQAAVDFCKITRSTLWFPDGVYQISETINLNNLPGGGNGITIIGGSNLRHGGAADQKPSVLLQWTGGADAMFETDASYSTMEGFGVENLGSATRFMTLTGGQHLSFRRLSFITNNPIIKRFADAVFYSEGNNLGYSIFDNIHCFAAAENFIVIDGMGSGNGVTPFEIRGRSVFESNGDGSMTVVYVKDEGIDQLSIRNCTFNQQSNKLVILDTRDTPVSQVLTQFTFEENEIDIVSSVGTDRMFYFTNCENISFNKNQVQGGGAITALAELVNSTVTDCESNSALSIAGPFFNADSNSAVFPGVNQLDVLNTLGIVSDATNKNILRPTFGAIITLQPHKLPADGIIEITATSNIAHELRIEHPANGYMVVGKPFMVVVRNNTAGALGAVTLDARYTWKVAGGAFISPGANSYRRWLGVWTGSEIRELDRGNFDIPL